MTTNLSRLASQKDMANLEIIRDIIFDLPPEEFNKIHYHLYPLVLIERLMEQ
ncbi:hypothetical protein [Reichenbachiella ulvae]|uniref:Uncharacterized protein n=1 Tax=Reichenbachiella ulvae TaxID=2980104 RepID=A0ABT3CSK2_9BACT|nr:hypothetical protein [Reichenbachiella ulvae]MCV9386597.1 hypothetical protein [Reichenbachiella ulvae]